MWRQTHELYTLEAIVLDLKYIEQNQFSDATQPVPFLFEVTVLQEARTMEGSSIDTSLGMI